MLSYVLLWQPVHFNEDNSAESGGKGKTGNEEEDLESRLPKYAGSIYSYLTLFDEGMLEFLS